MACTSKTIPLYLHTNGKVAYAPESFEDGHLIYRVTPFPGNPVEFPNTITAYSCKWSFIINEEYLLKANDPPIGKGYKYSFVKPVRSYSTKSEVLSGDYIGWHKLTCLIEHTPQECDYSHCEILIRHQFFTSGPDTYLQSEWVYAREDWDTGKTVLQRKQCKELRNNYRRDLISLFYLP